MNSRYVCMCRLMLAPLRCLVSIIIPQLRQRPIPEATNGSHTGNNSSSSSSSKFGNNKFNDNDNRLDEKSFFSDDEDEDDQEDNHANSQYNAASIDVNPTGGKYSNHVDIESKGKKSKRTRRPSGSNDNDNTSSPPASLSPFHPEYVPLQRVMLILVICIICIGCLASWIIMLCTDLAAVLSIDQSTLGNPVHIPLYLYPYIHIYIHANTHT